MRDKFLEELNLGYTEKGNIAAKDGLGTKPCGIFVAKDAKRNASLIV